MGSLLRPQYLKDAWAGHESGALSANELARAEDRAVVDGVELQEEAGIECVTDGEMRRRYWFDPLTVGLGGFGAEDAIGVFAHGDRGAQVLPVVNDKLSLARNLPLEESEFAARHATRPVKATLPSLTYASVLYEPGLSDRVYPDRDEYMQEALRLSRTVVQQLVDAGFTYIQLDAPRYVQLIVESGRERLKQMGLDPETWLDEMIALDNDLMEGFPEATFGIHICRGNNQGSWFAEGGYDSIAERLFSQLKAQRLFLEYDTPRAGTFAPLRFVSPEKTVVLGLITTKDPTLESDDEVKRRIEEAAEFVPLERLALSPQCGFASSLEGNPVDEDVQRRKLELVGRVAAEVWS